MKLALTLTILLSISFANAGIADNLSIGSGMDLPDKGVEVDYNYYNRDQHASASMFIQVNNDGAAGKYFLPERVNFQIYPGYDDNDTGLRRFSLNSTYIITSEKPEPEVFRYVLGGEYDSKDTEIYAYGSIRNGSDWDYDGEDWYETISSDIITSLYMDIDSPSAEFYEMEYDVREWTNSWDGTEYMEVRMSGTFHTPEPATMSMLCIGAIAMIRRRKK